MTIEIDSEHNATCHVGDKTLYVFFSYTQIVHFCSKSDPIIPVDDVLSGEADFSPTRMRLKVKEDRLFDGEYQILTFIKED